MRGTGVLEAQLREISSDLIEANKGDVADLLRASRRLVEEHRAVADLGELLAHQHDMQAIPVFYLFRKITDGIYINFGLDAMIPLPVDSEFLLGCLQNLGKFIQSTLGETVQTAESVEYLFNAVRNYHLLVFSIREEERKEEA